jgi:hypothetical protein
MNSIKNTLLYSASAILYTLGSKFVDSFVSLKGKHDLDSQNELTTIWVPTFNMIDEVYLVRSILVIKTINPITKFTMVYCLVNNTYVFDLTDSFMEKGFTTETRLKEVDLDAFLRDFFETERTKITQIPESCSALTLTGYSDSKNYIYHLELEFIYELFTKYLKICNTIYPSTIKKASWFTRDMVKSSCKLYSNYTQDELIKFFGCLSTVISVFDGSIKEIMDLEEDEEPEDTYSYG